ncbi:MAG: DUF1189 family protein [Opitutales bacterium]
MEFLSTFWRSFWSPLAYKNALTWRWKIFAYFLLLALFSSIILSVAIQPRYDNFINKQAKLALSDFQTIEIIDNKVKTQDAQNYSYDLPDGTGLLSVSETQNPSPKDYLVAIEGDKVIVASTVLPLSDFVQSLGIKDNLSIDKAEVFKLLDSFSSLYYLLTPPMLFLSTLVSNLFFVLILSIAAYTMLMTSPLKLGYFSALKIAVLAITPMTLFQSISPFFTTQDSAGFLYGLISIALTWYVIKKLTAKEKEIEIERD